ncbi:hypothetical protein P3L10_008427 [Capsicum annuum]
MDFIHEDVWESWQRLWANPKCVEKSQIMHKIIVEAKKSLLELTREDLSQLESTERDLLLKWVEIRHQVSYICMFTHMVMMENLSLMNVPKSSIFEEILREKTLLESVIDRIEAYYQAAGGEKKRRIFGLGSEAKGYYGQTLCISCGKTSSSASHESVLAADSDLDEFVKRLIPSLKNQFFPIVIEEVQKLVS